ncbi:DEAD/DEAH box helicase [Nocardioides massiliensis]|uniref:Superfamily II DNA or RNA helicase n=1 Tax=Nocardioides massiliensis TaxID=1325935 RepID=A0ABT9NU16_9ACTN|nr:DEAD/DEAH box helicase [Nocardioides massiliensis]MDP9823928.1 superfamily II DNA or RNA helicase [Nocardioides massiliensis]
MAQRQGRSRHGGTAARAQRRHRDNEGILPILAKAAREIESRAQRGELLRTTFQVVAVLAREERMRVKNDDQIGEARRDAELKRLDGIAKILGQVAGAQPELFELLDENAELTDSARALKREMQLSAGLEPEPEPERVRAAPTIQEQRQVVPRSVIAAQLANPFLVPDSSGAEPRLPESRRLAGWELMGPLLSSFEKAGAGAPSCMELPDPDPGFAVPPGLELMPHQARLIAAAAGGHRTFLLADEPGLGKTAQALLAAKAANAYPLLCVVPSVVKTNWAREAAHWTPNRSVSVVQGNGEDLDGFADIIIVNYEVLDRHSGWMGTHGFRGMVLDEAHFIKNKQSQRSQHVIDIADRIRRRVGRPLMMALTGTPLINDIDDFRTIWQFLGWTDEKHPRPRLLVKLEETGLTPLDREFSRAARQAVIDMGIVRRRKVDVAKEIPARRIADLPVELDSASARSIQGAERELALRLAKRYDSSIAAREERTGERVVGIDHELVRRVAAAEIAEPSDTSTGENVFTLVRRIGQAKASLAAEYAAQLARSTGKVVFFAKHIDVMDKASELFAAQGIGYSSIRGEQTPAVRQKNIDAFVNDPDIAVAVCSLTAAGVGVNLQVASNVVLAELSWTHAEQTQAIDRVHRIGQEEPVTAWRIIAAHTVDARIAGLVDAKAGLAARALDGSDEEVAAEADVQLEALVSLLTDELSTRR